MAEVTAAIVSGVFGVIAALLAAYYQHKVAKRRKEERGAVPTSSPAPPRLAETSRKSVETARKGTAATRTPADRSAAAASSRGDEDDPAKTELPLHRPGESYRGLGGEELEVRMLTDAELHVRQGDTFIFDDKGQA